MCVHTDYCNLGDIRLVNSTNRVSGRVELCSRGRWSPICGDSSWGNEAADVACRQLGREEGEKS